MVEVVVDALPFIILVRLSFFIKSSVLAILRPRFFGGACLVHVDQSPFVPSRALVSVRCVL